MPLSAARARVGGSHGLFEVIGGPNRLRTFAHDYRAAPRGGFQAQAGADRSGALAHAVDAKTFGCRTLRIEYPAIVGDLDPNHGRINLKRHFYCITLGVAQRVRDRLLRDAIQVVPIRPRHGHGRILDRLEIEAHSTARSGAFHERPQRLNERSPALGEGRDTPSNVSARLNGLVGDLLEGRQVVRARRIRVNRGLCERAGQIRKSAQFLPQTVCGEAESVDQAKAAIRTLKPEVVVVDISLKRGDGIELIKDTRADNPTLPILVLSMHDETIYAERMLSAGASGYIMKEAPSDQFLKALRRVLEGRIYVSEGIGQSVMRQLASGGTRTSANPLERLSNRELQILHLIGRGLSTRQAAEALSLSVKTVESHRERIKRKLNLATGSQLVQYAVNFSR